MSPGRAGLACSVDPPQNGLIRPQPALSPSPLRLFDLCRGRPARSIRRGEHDKTAESLSQKAELREEKEEIGIKKAAWTSRKLICGSGLFSSVSSNNPKQLRSSS